MNHVRTVNFLISFMTNVLINEEKFEGSSHCFIIVMHTQTTIVLQMHITGMREREREIERKWMRKQEKMNEYMIWL